MTDSTAINGWKIYLHPCFESQLFALVEDVQALKVKHPESYKKRAATKLLAAVFKVINTEICANPTQAKFRQGDTLGENNKHWFRAKFLMQYRLFFRYSEKHNTIILAWMNDSGSKRTYDSKRDAYKVFAAMLINGHPPGDWDALLEQSRADERFVQALSQS